MRPAIFMLVVIVSWGPIVRAQDNVIVLKVGPGVASLGEPKDGQVTVTLASGDKITVRLSDIDLASTRRAMGMPQPAQGSGAQSSSASVSPSEILLSPSALESAINQKCGDQWKTDFQMQAFCRRQQNEAATNLRRRSMSSSDESAIRTQCIAQWANDFQMRNFCEEQQLKALQELRK